MKIINDRFEIVQPLSRDGNIVEYLVTDKEKDGQQMRIKIFDTEMSNQEYIRTLEDRFIDIKNLKHENLLSAYTFQPIISINGNKINRKQYFYTYEHYDDSGLIAYTMLNKSDLISVIVQLCKVVRFLHFKGIIYKYLNFDQILFLKENNKVIVKIKDLAHNHITDYHFKLDHERFQQFVAPEILWGDEIDKTADLYSLGALFYYIYYRVDYKLKSINSVIKATNANDIHKFIGRTISHIKEDRYETINQFIAVLAKLIWIEIDNNDYSFYNVIHDDVHIVGREGIIKDIRNLLNEKYKKTLSYHGVYLRGENGVGKTRILREIGQIAKFNRYFTVKMAPKSNDINPLPMVTQIIKAISDEADVSPLLIQKYGLELIALVPELAEKWNIKSTTVLDANEHYLRILNRAFNFFMDYSSYRFVVLLLDDESLLSLQERYFFDQLLEYKGHANYFLIFTGTDIRKKDTKNEMLRLIKLPSLNLEETGELVRASLGISEIPYRLTHRLMLESQGKPDRTKRILYKLWTERYIFFDSKAFTWNLEKIDDSFSFDDIEGQKESYDHILETLDSNHIELLKQLSLLKGSFNSQVVFDYGNINEEDGYAFLNLMEDYKILNKRISDIEYVFVFHNNELRKTFYDRVPVLDREQLYSQIADYYEKQFRLNEEVQESLIDYYNYCGNNEKAAEVCKAFANIYLTRNNNLKAVELFEKAMAIYERTNNTLELISTGIPLIKLMIKIGVLDQANDMIDLLLPWTERTYKKAFIDLSLLKSSLFFFRNELSNCYDIALESQKRAQEIQYEEGRLEAIFFQCKCLISENDLSKHLDLVLSALEDSKKLKSELHYGRFQNELGVNHLYQNRFSESMLAFNESLGAYKNINDDENVIKAYNNLGVVQLEGDGDYYISRDFFRKAYTLANNRNYLVVVPVQLSNLGETYLVEGRYEMAIKYFEEAHQIAERIGDRNMILLSLLNLCYTLILTEKYAKSFTMMNRLEHEFITTQRKSYNRLDYYFLHFEFFLAMNSLMHVDKWRSLMEVTDIVDQYRRFRLTIIDLSIAYKKNKTLRHTIEYDYARLKELVDETKKPSHAKLLRGLILDLLIDLIEYHDYIRAESLIHLDNTLSVTYNTKLYRVKRDVIDACLSDYAIDRLLLLVDIVKPLSVELLWRIYKMIGTEYYYKNHYYDALKYDLMSLDVLSDLTSSIPHEFKETYILYDDSKMALKYQIQKIIKSFITRTRNAYDDRYDTVDDFFDLRLLNHLYEEQSFMNLVYDKYEIQNFEKYNNATDLIKNFEKDEIKNLRMILKYLQQMTIAEHASLYLLDENDNINEIIHANDSNYNFDLTRLINNFGNDMDGIYVSKVDPHTNVQILSSGQKALVCFPIYETTSTGLGEEKRKEDLLVTKKKISGYVFLDTDNVIHRFNEESFKHAKSFVNLIYVFIDNYNLKRISTIDKLTGVYLRKFIEQQFAIQMSISRQQNFNLSVIMLDIDKFKNVNDTYGHRKGDEILTQIGALIRKAIRSSDYVGRYGGEEFIILLPETDAVSGFKVAEKIRTQIMEQRLLGDEMPLTVSLGISTYPKDGANEEELIERADQALYYSKNNGRNQATSWDEELLQVGHRYDRLTGILTGNISSDTRNVQAILDILNQLVHGVPKLDCIKSTFISLLDITEGDEVQFIKYDLNLNVQEMLYKRKGHDVLESKKEIDNRVFESMIGTDSGNCFIDWDEISAYGGMGDTPNWKSYILLSFSSEDAYGILMIAVPIGVKEFDFSNYNFVEALRPVLKHILFH